MSDDRDLEVEDALWDLYESARAMASLADQDIEEVDFSDLVASVLVVQRQAGVIPGERVEHTPEIDTEHGRPELACTCGWNEKDGTSWAEHRRR